jgi:hypothetical protein
MSCSYNPQSFYSCTASFNQCSACPYKKSPGGGGPPPPPSSGNSSGCAPVLAGGLLLFGLVGVFMSANDNSSHVTPLTEPVETTVSGIERVRERGVEMIRESDVSPEMQDLLIENDVVGAIANSSMAPDLLEESLRRAFGDRSEPASEEYIKHASRSSKLPKHIADNTLGYALYERRGYDSPFEKGKTDFAVIWKQDPKTLYIYYTGKLIEDVKWAARRTLEGPGEIVGINEEGEAFEIAEVASNIDYSYPRDTWKVGLNDYEKAVLLQHDGDFNVIDRVEIPNCDYTQQLQGHYRDYYGEPWPNLKDRPACEGIPRDVNR